MSKMVRAWQIAALIVIGAVLVGTSAYAEPASTNYRFDETAIGTSNLLESNSTNFKASTGAGDTAAGFTSSTNFQSQTGSDTSPDPNLTFAVNSGSAALGTFTPAAASTSTATFTVINYTSYGYVVQIIGSPPSYGSKQINAMSANAVSQPGVEQFGINLVANTSPISFGANPDNGTSPNNFGFGAATSNYSTSNQFRYVSGETIAQAPKSSGRTDYTISYIVNVTSVTPGGTYGSDQTLIVTGTY